MTAMTNMDVITSFLRHRACQSSMSTDGERLLSYNKVIAKWEKGGERGNRGNRHTGDRVIMPESSRYFSHTTSRHRNLLIRIATIQGITVVQMN